MRIKIIVQLPAKTMVHTKCGMIIAKVSNITKHTTTKHNKDMLH